MSLKQQFEEALKSAKELTKRPGNNDLLKLYALFKQATEGDVTGERPGGFDFKGAAKYDAWEEVKGKKEDVAMQEYINLVKLLHNNEA